MFKIDINTNAQFLEGKFRLEWQHCNREINCRELVCMLIKIGYVQNARRRKEKKTLMTSMVYGWNKRRLVLFSTIR